MVISRRLTRVWVAPDIPGAPSIGRARFYLRISFGNAEKKDRCRWDVESGCRPSCKTHVERTAALRQW